MLKFTVELFMLSHVEKRKKSVAGKSIVLRGQKVVQHEIAERYLKFYFFIFCSYKLDFFVKFSTKCLLLITFYHIKTFSLKILPKQKIFLKEIKLSQVFDSIFPQPPLKVENRLWISKDSDWLPFFVIVFVIYV